MLPPPTAPFLDAGYVPGEIWDRIDAAQRAQAGEETDPATEIVQAAAQSKTDVLVLGTHGRTGVSRVMLGSVAGRVVATATCPVLTVRAAEPAGA